MADSEDYEEPPERLVLKIASALWFVLGSIVGVFGVAMAGIFLSNKSGEYPKWLESSHLPDTIVAVTAILAAITGVWGVVMVAKTLRATSLTLKSQLKMTKSQSNINAAEIRPWVFVESVTLSKRRFDNETGKHLIDAIVTYKNIGKTPAMYFRETTRSKIQTKPFDRIPKAELTELVEYNSLGPGLAHVTIVPNIEIAEGDLRNTLIMRWSYHRITNFETENAPLQVTKDPTRHTETVYFKDHNEEMVVIRTKVFDFKR